GVKDKEDGLRQLKLLFANCLDRQDLLTDWQRKHLLQNYLVYYDFPLETVQEAFKEELQRGRVYQTLLAGQAEGADLYQAICHLSAYQPKNNPMLKKEPEKFYGLLSQVWQEVRRNPYQLLKLLVGEKTVFPVEMFADAVFYSPHPVTEASVEIGAGLSYRCRGGHWISELYWPSSRQKKLLADFMHEFDRLSRLAFKKGRSLKEKPLPPAFKQAISQGIADYQQQLLEAQRPKIKINLASLDQIRADAAETKESLLTEEERELEAQEAAEQAAAQAAAESTAAFSADLNLNETERKLLEALFAGQPYKDFLRQQHQLLSVVVDQINEKLFDEIGDAVIDCDGESAEIVPDYRADLADLLGIEE
ncbi:tellurite resistance TerB C-terminal domain-containing protein, partial [Lactobacillus nasalidis]